VLRLSGMKRALDPDHRLNRGVLLGLRLRGLLGRAFTALLVPGVELLRLALDAPAMAWLPQVARTLASAFPGPAHGRGEPLETAGQAETARAIHCVNCGECNSVCPIFHESKIRLPQMLTHAGEALHAGERPGESAGALLDLCMRCGNCEEVCQAGIRHLPLYGRMQEASNAARPYRRDRHETAIAALRSSNRYLHEFLDARPGGYVKRAPASLAGLDRYVVLRAENDAGPAASCLHCGACVAVCPTEANREFEGLDPRSITTDQGRCIGCGTCVEVCPANLANGGQTLRVMEAPTRDWFVAVDEFQAQGGGARPAAAEPSISA
jgi:ferredoxin